MSRDGVPWERGPGSDGEGAQSPQMSPDQRRAELAAWAQSSHSEHRAPRSHLPSLPATDVGSRGLQVKTGPRPPTRL